MNKALLIAPMLLLISSPAFSQDAHGSDGRDSYSRTDRDVDDIMRALGESGRGGPRRGSGAGFFLRNGDNVVAVRCDPQDSMKACVDTTLMLLERAKSMQASGAAPGGQPPSH